MTDARDSTSDEALAERAAAGDRASFGHLIRRYKEPLYRLIRRYVGQRDDAYDILQDTFVACWTGLHRYDPRRPFGPWLRTIALNKCRDFGRRQTVYRTLLRLVAVNAKTLPPNDAGDVDEQDPVATRLALLDKAIARLPAIYKEPLLLTTVEKLSHEETATILKTTRKAVEMRLYRARQRLAKEIRIESEG